jgi:hypothetical protein
LLHVDLWVEARILPALETLIGEHVLTEDLFIQIAEGSSVVPPGRHMTVGKGLLAGFKKDFPTAIHLLTPQVENLVRWHLKSRGAETTIRNMEGIETELSLNKLVELDLACEILQPGLLFEIKALFVHEEGPNLRNRIAHGLADDSELNSNYVIYAWWLIFSLVYFGFIYEKGANGMRRRYRVNNEHP